MSQVVINVLEIRVTAGGEQQQAEQLAEQLRREVRALQAEFDRQNQTSALSSEADDSLAADAPGWNEGSSRARLARTLGVGL